MRRALPGALLLIGACGRCKSNDVVSIRDDPAKSDATLDAGSDAASAIPAEWQGTYAIAVAADADASSPVELRRFVVDAHGAGPSAKILASDDPVPQMKLTPDGATLVFTTGAPSLGQTIQIVPLAGGAPKEIASCTYQCDVMGVGADGEVWYVARESDSLIGDVHHVPLAGGASVAWPNTFSDCHIGGTTSDDGTALLLGVDNSLGWPECIALGRQGFFVVPITDAARRDRLPKRIDCFTTTHVAKEINIQIWDLSFEGADRVRLTVLDGWSEVDGEPNDEATSWSCKRDGTDPRRVSGPGPALAVVDEAEGEQALVVMAEHGEHPGDALYAIVKHRGAIASWAFRKR